MEFPELGANCALTTCKQLGEFVEVCLRFVKLFFLEIENMTRLVRDDCAEIKQKESGSGEFMKLLGQR